ncbi:MAG: IS66 family transposase [Acidobacteria bacterium]|nr:MAG: IS66 family transposase [Acidobacteriota bacterium]
MNWSDRLEELVLTQEQRDAFLDRMRVQVGPEDYRRIETFCQLAVTLGKDNLSKLRHLLFGRKTETTDRVCPVVEPAPAAAPKPPPKGHGRCGARQYTGARWIEVSHRALQKGQRCPQCQKGSLRAQRRRGVVLRIKGSPPISATGWSLEKLRCDTCGEVFTAPAPPEAGTTKYDESVGVTVAVLRYGSGMPHYRLARLQQSLGVPLPESTQWELMAPLFELALPIFEELLRQTAQSPLLHNDDTSMRILDLRRPGSATAAEIAPERKGTFTTGIVGSVSDHPVALFMTGWRHAGENLARVLQHRAAELPPPIQMCDALSRNTCGEFDSILANCLGHGRREFVALATSFPEQVRFVLEQIREAQQRLLHHQTHSQPVMDKLHQWMSQQLEEKRVEPNSGLGQAMGYLLRHWEPLTLFLRQAGAPLDNNVCERALKMAILHRKNSLSYKTLNGAQTGDLFMSLIHTCRLNGVNPFEYLLAIVTHPEAVKLVPQAWLPWNYPNSATTPDSS